MLFSSIRIEEYKRIEQLIPNLFLLGPTMINGRIEEEYKSTIHKDVWIAEDFIRRREIISSGSCVALRKIEEVGLMMILCLLTMWIMDGVGERFMCKCLEV